MIHHPHSSCSAGTHHTHANQIKSLRYQTKSPNLPTTEVRQEAVQQALAALKNRPKPSLPMPSKRSSVLNRSPERDRDDSGNSRHSKTPSTDKTKLIRIQFDQTGSVSKNQKIRFLSMFLCFRSIMIMSQYDLVTFHYEP